MVARTGIRLGANPQYQSVVLFDQYSRSHQSQIFEVRETPIVISAFGLQIGETLQVFSSLLSPEGELLEPFLLNGNAVVLTATTNSAQLTTAGRYRVVFTGVLLLDMVCTYKHQTGGTNKDIRQPSGVQANRPNLFFDGKGVNQTSQIIEIQNTPWMFSVYGLLGGESITVYNTCGYGSDYQQEVYLFKGVPQILTPTNNALILNKSGRYRFVLVGDPTHVILVGNETIDALAVNTNVVGGVQSVVAGTGINVNNTDPANPIVSATGGPGGGQVNTVVAGAGVTINSADPVNPVIALSGATLTLLALAGSAVQPGANISVLANDVGYVTGAILTGTITNGDTTHAPTGDAVFDALALKVNLTRNVNTGTGLIGGGDLNADRTISLNAGSITSLGLANTAAQPGANISIFANNVGYLTSASLTGYVQDSRNINTGTGLTGGGDLTADRTIALNAGSIASLALANTAVQPGANISVFVNNSGYVTNAILTATITNGDTTHAPTGDAVFDALAAISFPVTSVFGRVGNVVAAANDYTFAQISSTPTTLAGYGITDAVPSTRTITTTAPLTGGGNLSANRVFTISAASGAAAGSMSAADFTKLAGIAAGATVYTDALARTAIIASTIVNGDTTHSPSGDAVFDALALKADDSNVVHKTGTENVGGLKTFTDNLVVNVPGAAVSATVDGSAGQSRDVVWRTAGSLRWILRTTNAAESGSNAGSNFRLLARDDAGSLLFNVFEIARDTGIFDFLIAPTRAGNAIWDAGNMPLARGVYTPTATAVANVSANTPQPCTWMRVGNSVTVSGRIDVTPTAANVFTQIRFTLPVPSNFTAVTDASGVATWNISTTGLGAGFISTDIVNDQLVLNAIPNGILNTGIRFAITYPVLP